jgi:glycerol uptake facilitator protein
VGRGLLVVQMDFRVLNMPNTIRTLVAEGLGTFILVLFGCGAVHATVLTGAHQGLWQVAIVWGSGVAFAAYCVGAVSGAHINPAMTISLATWVSGRWWTHIGVQSAGAYGCRAVCDDAEH